MSNFGFIFKERKINGSLRIRERNLERGGDLGQKFSKCLWKALKKQNKVANCSRSVLKDYPREII